MKVKLKVVLSIIVVVLMIGALGWIVYNKIRSNSEETVNPVATFEIQDYGTVKMELYPEYAPNTVSNFIALIESGFYNNKIIYGKDKMCLYMARDDGDDAEGAKISLIDKSIEAGSDGDYEYEINGEFIANGFEQNTLMFEKGIISLNHSDYSSYGLKEEGYNSGSSQFSVMMGDDVGNLNGMYCAFGKITEGMDVLEKIYNEAEIQKDETEAGAEETTQTEDDDESVKEFANKPVITNASVEKNGVEYGMPETHKAFDIQSYINSLYSQYYN